MLLKHINADTLRDDLTQAVCDRAFIGEDELPRNEKSLQRTNQTRPQPPARRQRSPQPPLAGNRHRLRRTERQTRQTPAHPPPAPTPANPARCRLRHPHPVGTMAAPPHLPQSHDPAPRKIQQQPRPRRSPRSRYSRAGTNVAGKTDGLVKQGLPVSDDLAAFRWMIEELRVSLFAQELKTPYPVSVKRLLKEWDNIKLTY